MPELSWAYQEGYCAVSGSAKSIEATVCFRRDDVYLGEAILSCLQAGQSKEQLRDSESEYCSIHERQKYRETARRLCERGI